MSAAVAVIDRPLIKVEHLSKAFEKNHVLIDVNLEIPEKSIYVY